MKRKVKITILKREFYGDLVEKYIAKPGVGKCGKFEDGQEFFVTRETYDRSKIEAGIIHSCHKRPVSPQQINSMIDEIENQIFNMEEKEVPTSAIGELVMGKLKDLDEVAYVRFASVYREFKDVNTFIDEIGKLLKK